jgi:hypothetical protein
VWHFLKCHKALKMGVRHSPETTFSAFPGRTDWADDFRSGHVAVANAIPHGVALKGQTTTVHARDGAKLVLREPDQHFPVV